LNGLQKLLLINTVYYFYKRLIVRKENSEHENSLKINIFHLSVVKILFVNNFQTSFNSNTVLMLNKTNELKIETII